MPSKPQKQPAHTVSKLLSSTNEPSRLRSKNLRAQPIAYRSNQRGFFDSMWYDDPFSSRGFGSFGTFGYNDNDYFNNVRNQYYDTAYRGYEDPYSKLYEEYYGGRGNKGNKGNTNNNSSSNRGGFSFVDYYNNNKQIKADPEADKRAQTNWKKVTQLVQKDQGLKIFQTIAAVLKAIRVLTNSEESIFDGTVSLAEKIRLYQILEENQHIVDFLSQPVSSSTYEDLNDDEAQIEYDEEDENEEAYEEEQYEEDDEDYEMIEQFNENIQNLTLDELNTRIESIEKLIHTADADKKEQLNELYEKKVAKNEKSA